MKDEPLVSLERMIEVAVSRGLSLDTRRAGAIQPAVESLLRRLGALARELPPDLGPAPGPVDLNR